MKNKLPDCQLIDVLNRKASSRNDVVFDYLGKLEALRIRVGGEVRFINELFPEYTPHDEEYHLSRLFHVADTLIGTDRYESMNATELFVLACGLYGHDWGMAVSIAERNFIVSGKVPEGFSASDFALLLDEHKTFSHFLKERGLDGEVIKTEGIAIEDWREYVRKTHAFRSGERIRHYFRDIDSGIGEAGGRVCEGHWLDIEDIQDFHRYPPNFAVLRENLNLAALAIYVRLVDLLDIGHDRTPYVIWKFVAPRNSYSKMEWEKHRALQPITCPQYLNGRVVLVDGSTDNHEVYAALEDLRSYAEKQLRECMDVLSQLGDPRHLLDLYHVEWRVVARGFDPVLVRFEFDRERVFEILSSEIYQGDSYVFLRELLQNSIDAIRMRRELLEHRGGIKLEGFGLIHVNVEYRENGDTKIIWTDDGIGMDAYVLRNYLAVAGRSYYRSEEFERQGLKLDPISKFGVGILSCFMVANMIEIETSKDPYATSVAGALKVTIPSITRQFRIERSPLLDFGIGTKVTVHVEGRLLGKKAPLLQVTRYLKKIAGFVEFPIVISENSKVTVILHPKSLINPLTDSRFQQWPNIQIHQLSFGYPFDKAIFAQDVDSARAELVEKSLDLNHDLRLLTSEGCITYVDLRDKNKWISFDHDSGSGGGFVVKDKNSEEVSRIRWKPEWFEFDTMQPKEDGLSRSADTAPSYSIYRDGVLVPNASLPAEYTLHRRHAAGFSVPYLIVNLVKPGSTALDLARAALRSNGEHWFEPVNNALMTRLTQELADELANLPAPDALRRIGLFIQRCDVDSVPISTLDPLQMPIAILSNKGNLEFSRWLDWHKKSVRVCPEILKDELMTLVRATFSKQTYEGYLTKWRGYDTLVTSIGFYQDLGVYSGVYFANRVLREFYVLDRVELLRPPGNRLPPIVQEVWEPKNAPIERPLEIIAAEVMVDPASVSPIERSLFLDQTPHTWGHKFIQIPFDGPPPFGVGKLYNLNHPIAELLFRSLAWLMINEVGEKSSVDVGRMRDAVSALLPYEISAHHARTFTDAAKVLFAMAHNLGLSGSGSTKNVKVRARDVWHTARVDFDRIADKHVGTFGQPTV